MKEINVTGQKREALGKKASKTLRKEGLVPCNLYGLAEQDGKPVAKSFAIAMTELRKIIYTPHVYVINLIIDGESHTAIMKEIQFRDGGRMNLSIRKIDVTAPYQQIPEHLDIDVTALKIGKSIKVGELSFEGLEIATGKDVIVCSIKMTRAAMSAAANAQA